MALMKSPTLKPKLIEKRRTAFLVLGEKGTRRAVVSRWRLDVHNDCQHWASHLNPKIDVDLAGRVSIEALQVGTH
jgi:hypothetical protein